jgi:hypothetical protein
MVLATSSNLAGFTIYADADGNGVADNAVDLSLPGNTSVTLASGGIIQVCGCR